MQATIEDEETIAGFVAAWEASEDLLAAVPGGIKSGVLAGGQKEPYAKISSVQGPTANQYVMPVGRKSGYHDFRHVVIRIVGKKPDIVKALSFVRDLFENQPKGDPTSQPQISGGVLKRVKPLPGCNRLEPAPVAKQGDDRYTAVAEYEVWTVRQVP